MQNNSFQFIIDRTVTKDKDITRYGIRHNNKKYFIEEVYIKSNCHIKIYNASNIEIYRFRIYETMTAINNVKLQDVDDRFIKIINRSLKENKTKENKVKPIIEIKEFEW